jgi:protein-L-isoaspartate(D-aspartate) O-methyltransferase
VSPGEKPHNPFILISLLNIGVSLSKQELVEYLVRYGYIKTTAVKNAFLGVPRDNFVLDKTLAWKDTPLPIPCNQTISAPSMIAIMLEALELVRGDRVLEVGAGSGYNAALIAEIVGQENVVSVERIERLAEFARDNLMRCGYEIEIVVGDGTKGYPPRAPYDKIIVTAAAPTIPPPLVEQTRSGGLIAIPVGSRHFYQDFMLARKIDEGRVEERNLGGCAFVPLVGEYGWRE